MDLTIVECEELYLQYIGKEPCKHNFVDDIFINCNERKHNFSNNVCIKCGEENCKKLRPKQNTVFSLIDLRNLNLDCDNFSATFEMYQQTMVFKLCIGLCMHLFFCLFNFASVSLSAALDRE